MDSPATPSIRVTGAAIAAERDWLRAAAGEYVELINQTRRELAQHFDQEVEDVSAAGFRAEVETVFDAPARAANVTGLIRLARAIDVSGDYPGFVVDEQLGRRLAATIAGGEPEGTLAEATFHVIDVRFDRPADVAGADDLGAGIAAGFQTRLPGWEWQSDPSPFDPPP